MREDEEDGGVYKGDIREDEEVVGSHKGDMREDEDVGNFNTVGNRDIMDLRCGDA